MHCDEHNKGQNNHCKQRSLIQCESIRISTDVFRLSHSTRVVLSTESWDLILGVQWSAFISASTGRQNCSQIRSGLRPSLHCCSHGSHRERENPTESVSQEGTFNISFQSLLENRVEMNTGIHEGITAPSWFIHSTHFLVSYWHMHFLCMNITAIKQEGVEYEFQIDWNNQQCITWKDELAPFGIVENGVKACILSSAPQIFPNIVMCQFPPSSQLTPTKSWGWRLARSSSVTHETTRSFLNCCSCYVTGQMCTFVGKALSVLLPRHELMDTHDWLASLLHLSIRVTPFLPPREYNRFWCLGLPAMDGFGIQTQDFQKTVWTIFSCITQV